MPTKFSQFYSKCFSSAIRLGLAMSGFVGGLSTAPQARATAEKAHLLQILTPLQKKTEIHSLFSQTSELSRSPVDQLSTVATVGNLQILTFLEKQFQSSENFVRGEAELPRIHENLLACLQLALLQARTLAFDGKWNEVQNHLSAWFAFAADFPYEESSIQGLQISVQIRSLLLDELEKMQSKFAISLATSSEFRIWFSRVRAPWPVDRILIAEAKRSALPGLIPLAEKAARAYQKNPYQTTEKVLSHSKGHAASAAVKLSEIWSAIEIHSLRVEITRIGKLKLRLAAAEYLVTRGRAPATTAELVSSGLLQSVPADYLTGRPLDLTSL